MVETKMLKDYTIQFGEDDIKKATDILALTLLKELVKAEKIPENLVRDIKLKYTA